MRFEPALHVENASRIVDGKGEWPSFHDAVVKMINLETGDIRPDDDVWVGPSVEIQFKLEAVESPFVVALRFSDCDQISLQDFNHSNDILDLTFEFEDRGFFTDGKPLPPYIRVKAVAGFGVSLELVCFRVSVLQ